MSKQSLSAEEVHQVLNLPKCKVDGKLNTQAHIDICSASKKFGGIQVTVHPIINGQIKGPQEIRQKVILDNDIQREVVNFAQEKKKKKKGKGKWLSARKNVPVRNFAKI
jgi:hypothetical protein